MEDKIQIEQIVIPILKRILGNPKSEREGQSELEFNCPSRICKNDHNKHNLWFNSKLNIFQCWKCKYKGNVHKLVEDFGTQAEIDRINLVVPKIHKFDAQSFFQKDQNSALTCKMPYGCKSLLWKNKSEIFKKSIEYLENRKVDVKKIQKHNIGYIEEGYYKDRIIIPSYNSEAEMNYFVARTLHSDITPSYTGPSKKIVKKDDIIFNESNVNFDLPVYLVEGVFDMFPLYNAVPLLGKFPSKPLIKKLIEHRSRVVICLDEDALRDGIELYNKLMSYGLDVYFIEVQDDVAKFYEIKGHEALINLLKNFKKIDLKLLLKLKLKDVKKNQNNYPEEFIKSEWEKLKDIFERLSAEKSSNL